MVWACCNCSNTQAAPVITQGAFFVDSVNGNDANDGLTSTTAIRTLAELARRFEGGVVSSALATMTIQLTGSFATEFLTLDFAFAGPTTITIKGMMTLVKSGTFTAVTAWNGAAAGADGTRGNVTDGAANFTTNVLQRFRLTAPSASVGALSHIASLGGGVTIANTGQFTSTAIATANPALGDGYAVESYATTVLGWSIHAEGPGTIRVEDLEFVSTVARTSGGQVSNSPNNLIFFGCRFNGTAAALIIANKQRFASCIFEGTLISTSFGNTNFLNCVFTNFIQLNNVNSLMQACLFEGGGARSAGLFCGNGSYLEVIGGSGNFGTAHYGVINGTATALLSAEDQATIVYSNAAANFIGATGNTTANGAVQVKNGTGLSYVTKGKATGVAPGVTDVVISGVGAAWAGVPAVAAAPNNGYINTRV